jgi:hypothetical protein
MLLFSAEKQLSIFFEFFNRIGHKWTLSLRINYKRDYHPNCVSKGNKMPVLALKVDTPAEKVSAEGIIDADSDGEIGRAKNHLYL